ncbi:hypothetical protein LguiA_007000 [Lonicera macranthoides]
MLTWLYLVRHGRDDAIICRYGHDIVVTTRSHLSTILSALGSVQSGFSPGTSTLTALFLGAHDQLPRGSPILGLLCQATLADRSGLWTSRSVVRCAVGSKPPVFICSLSIGEVASCKLDLEFEEKDDVVFSVKGPRGVHLAGYFLNSTGANSTSATVTTNAPNPQDKSLSISPQKKLKEVEVGDGSSEKAGFDLPGDALESHMKLQNGNGYTRSRSESKKMKKKKNKVMEDDDTHLEKGDLGEVYATESVDNGAIKGVDDKEQGQNDKLADVTDEGDHGGVYAMKSMDIGGIKGADDRKQSQNDKLADVTDERLHEDNGNALERSHSNEMKEKKKKKKKKKHDLDDDKHLGKKRKIERNEVAKEEATDGSAKENVKSYKKSDVKNIEGDVQDGNAKVLTMTFKFAMDSMEVEAKDSDNVEYLRSNHSFSVLRTLLH